MLNIEALLDSGSLNISIMREMKKVDDNKFSFYLKPDQTAIKQLGNSYGGTASIHTATVTIEFNEDGTIKEYTYKFGFGITKPIAPNMYVSSSITQTYICTYEY